MLKCHDGGGDVCGGGGVADNEAAGRVSGGGVHAKSAGMYPLVNYK